MNWARVEKSEAQAFKARQKLCCLADVLPFKGLTMSSSPIRIGFFQSHPNSKLSRLFYAALQLEPMGISTGNFPRQANPTEPLPNTENGGSY